MQPNQENMEVDHIFIFSNRNGKEADRLVDFGFAEGSSRVHPGQGTKNRKFYVENFFLEILWVVNEQEIQREPASKTKLWERSKFEENDCSPFGLCLVNSISTDRLFEKSEIYQPEYFPIGMSIDVITNKQNPNLPWTFRLPYRGEKKGHNEPVKHSNGIKKLTRWEFEIKTGNRKTGFEDYFKNNTSIAFKKGNRNHLTLEFDNKVQEKINEFPELNLTVKY